MKCEQVRELLDDYHYGELDTGQAAEIAGHVGVCDGCRTELQLLEREARMFDAYAVKTAGSIDLSPDLWQRALARAAAQNPSAARDAQRGSWLTRMMPSLWMRQAVAAVVLIGLSVGATLWVVNHNRSNRNDAAIAAQQPPAPANAKTLDAALQSIQKAEQEYLKAIRDLSDVVEKRKSALDPRIIAELQVSLRLIDDHIATTRKAYYAHPDDTELALHMLAAYSRKVELLQDLTAS